MTTYYKAVDAEARSFGDSEIVWRVGRIVRDPRPTPTRDGLCVSGLLHAATVPTEALTTHKAITWPFRLFEVEPRGAVRAAPGEPHKVGCRAWKVVRELDPALALGPQGQQVLDLIERAKHLTEDEARRLGAAWVAAWDAAWYAAGYAAREAAREAARVAARYASWYAAGDAAWDAACALVVRDLITDEQFHILAGPWEQVMGAL